MIVKGLPEGMSWAHSLEDHIRRNMEVNKWFQPENFQYVAGDAIQLAITFENTEM